MTYAPHVFHWVKFQSLYAFLFIIDDAAVAVAWVFLGEVTCHLRQGLVWCQTYAHWHSNPTFYFLVQPFAPLRKVGLVHALKIDEALVDAVSEICRYFLTDDVHDASCQLPVEFVV